MAENYCDDGELKAWLGITDSRADDRIDFAIEAASRWVDDYCGRFFYQDGTDDVPVVRTFPVTSSYMIDLGDVVSLDALASDDNSDGTYEVTWSTSDYQLEPVAPASGWPYTTVQAIATRVFPTPYTNRTNLVRATGIFGWPEVPTAVKQATLIQAARFFKRAEAPEGTAGGADGFGPIGFEASDQDVRDLLKRYRRGDVIVGIA